MTNRERVSIFWFRRDLRLNDNHGLFHALKGPDPVVPIFIFDKNILESLGDPKDRRLTFIHQSVERINRQLVKAGSCLWVHHDTPLGAFQTLCSSLDIAGVFVNHDYEPYAIQRDDQIAAFLRSKKIAFHSFKDQVIFEKREIEKADGTPYTVFTPYSNRWKEKFFRHKLTFCQSEKLISNFIKTAPLPFPSLTKIGFQSAQIDTPPPTIDAQLISRYDTTRDFPAKEGTSKLSVHLRFGTVSIRTLVKAAASLNEQWLNELIWREFFMMILFHFPFVVKENFKSQYNKIRWRNNELEFRKWCKGETGYPIVDAGMRQLNETGFMHNRVRMIVASFLTKHLLIDWRWGEAYFAEKLLDYELSSNNGNWQWAAGTGCDAAPYFRIFNPVEQARKFDPGLDYIRKWIKNFGSYRIKPMVEHQFARKRAIAAYEQALGKQKGRKNR